MKKFHLFVQIATGIIIIIFILSKLDIMQVLLVLKETDKTYFILACLSYLFLNLTLASRLSFLLKKIGHDVKFKDVFFSHMGGMIIGDITPGRSGYFLTPSILKRRSRVPVTEGMACIFAPQAIEFILKVGGAAAAILYLSLYSNIEEETIIYAGIGSAILLIVGILMLGVSWYHEKITSRFLGKIPILNMFTENLSSFKDRSIMIKDSLKVILVLYLIGWLFAALQWYFLGKAIGVNNISFFAFFLLHPLITILMFVPLTPAGFGIMEYAVIIVFSFFGIPAAPGMAFSVLVRISILLMDIAGLRSVMSASKY